MQPDFGELRLPSAADARRYAERELHQLTFLPEMTKSNV